MKGITPTILIALSIGLFYFYVNPQYSVIQTLQVDQERHDTALVASEELYTTKSSLIQRYDNFNESDVLRIQKFLPEQTDDVRVVLDIDTMARESGIVITNVDVRDTPESDPVLVAKKGGIVTDTNPYKTLYVSFSFDGTYTSFISFLKKMEMSLRIIDITDISFVQKADGTGYSFEVSLQTYWVK